MTSQYIYFIIFFCIGYLIVTDQSVAKAVPADAANDEDDERRRRKKDDAPNGSDEGPGRFSGDVTRPILPYSPFPFAAATAPALRKCEINFAASTTVSAS